MSGATIKTAHGSFAINEPYWGGYVELSDENGEEVGIYSPEHDDADSYGIQLKLSTRWLETEEEATSAIALLSAANDIAAMLRWAWAEEIEKAEERQREEEQRRQEEKERREQVLNERRDRLMMEFVGEEVKIREVGYKTARAAVVDVRDYYQRGEYHLYFRYLNDERTQMLARIKRLDVKVGSRWKTLWDDGTDDIGGDWALAGSAKPTGEMYDAMKADDPR